MWTAGKMPASMTANKVIASAAGLILVRQLLSQEKENGVDQRTRMADSDPKREVGDVPPQPIGRFSPHTPDACRDQVGNGREFPPVKVVDIAKTIHHQPGVFRSVIDATVSVMSPSDLYAQRNSRETERVCRGIGQVCREGYDGGGVRLLNAASVLAGGAAFCPGHLEVGGIPTPCG